MRMLAAAQAELLQLNSDHLPVSIDPMSTRVTSIDFSDHASTRLTPGLAQPSIAQSNRFQTALVHRLVTDRAAATPHALALKRGEESVTYRDLNDRANKLAHYLIMLGVGSAEHENEIVALCLDRSTTVVVCALAVLKAGGAYLPLDPGYPAERLGYMLRDAQPRVLITQAEYAHQFCESTWETIVIDRDQQSIDVQPSDDPAVEISLEQLAYVIYTSGSSGRPKGVEITHRSLMNLVSWHQAAFAVTSEDRATLLAGVSFDAAVWETWPYLTAGASLHLPDECTRLSPERLRDYLVNERISIGFLPTALAERVMTLSWPKDTALRTLLTGAEALYRFPSNSLPFKLVNNYGPTECTVVATSGVVSPSQGERNVPTIGRPIANTDVYILDEDLREVPVGTPGELFIGGAGLARGYLNQPELTAAKFIQNPFNHCGDSRLYRSGDLACYLEDGEIAYLGRIDDQIKIMGHRIEPKEIVTILNRHPAIQASVVIAHENDLREKHLVAYLVANQISLPGLNEIQTLLRNELPEQMVPSTFVLVDELPLTKNGKVDRAALPAPNDENSLRDDEFIAPRTPIETRLAETVSSLLGLEHVSVTGNFFMLGGHSLLGTQLISHIRSAFGVELALRTLFDSPTVAELSVEVEQLLLARVQAMSEDQARSLLT